VFINDWVCLVMVRFTLYREDYLFNLRCCTSQTYSAPEVCPECIKYEQIVFCLFITAPSGPPRALAGSPRSNSSVILQWQSPDQSVWNGQLIGYMIRYKPAGYPESTVSYSNVSGFLYSVAREITGLIVFQEYQISVAAYNRRGVGVYSDWIFVRTNEGRPTAFPTNLTAVALTSTTVFVSWMPPNPQYINGISQGYHVDSVMQLNNTLVSRRFTVASNTSNMLGLQTTVLQQLYKYAEYQLTVSCFTSMGDGPRSASIKVRTLEDGGLHYVT
jgi:protein sidekick